MNTEPVYNVSFTFVRQREDDAETKWRVEESHQQTPLIEGFDELDVILDARDAFGRRMIGVLCVPQSKLPDVLGAAEDLGGFLDLRGQELRAELLRRLYETLEMSNADDEAE